MAQPYLSIIIPAYNEAERLPLTLIDIDKHLEQAPYTYEILVVNDGSKDTTAAIVSKMQVTIKNLKLVDNKENKGKGGVVRQGMLLASGTIRLFTDADNSTAITHFETMMPYFKEGYGVVIGSRGIRGSTSEPGQPWYRKLPGKVGNIIIQLLVLWGVKDTQCGFKAMTAEVAEKVFNLSRIRGWGFDVELLVLARRLGYRIKEIPVHWVNDPSSRVGASAYLKVLLEVLKIRWWLWRNAYPSLLRH